MGDAATVFGAFELSIIFPAAIILICPRSRPAIKPGSTTQQQP
jgi:hypothetical protein